MDWLGREYPAAYPYVSIGFCNVGFPDGSPGVDAEEDGKNGLGEWGFWVSGVVELDAKGDWVASQVGGVGVNGKEE